MGYRVLISLAHVRAQPSLPVTGAVNGGKICGEQSLFVSVENAYYRKSGKTKGNVIIRRAQGPGPRKKPVVLTWVRMHGNILGKKGKKMGDVGNNQALKAACRILITGSRSLEGEASETGGVTEQDGKLVPSCELPGRPSLRLSMPKS